MTRDEIRAAVTQALAAIAPEVDSMELQPDVPLRDQVDLDSMDFLRFMMELHRRLGVDVPESDYGKLPGISAIVDYLAARLSPLAPPTR